MSLESVARFAAAAYGVMLCVVGAAGILSARWELGVVFGLDPGSWPRDVAATFLNQYRFLKAVELGSGVFCLAFLDHIIRGGVAALAFLVLVGLGVGARSIAWIADGRPAMAFIVFLALEAVVFVIVALHLKRAPNA